jgi:mono/diheme cytochrome c family protein
MKKACFWLLISALPLACGASLGQQNSGAANSLGSELAKAPASAATRENPYAGRADAVLAGRKLFKRHCAECHDPEGRGQRKAPDLHSPVVQDASPGTLFWFLKNGNLKEGMPSWSRLPDERLWQIVTYLKTLR